jgi:nucleoside-diphosphate kinase
MLLMIESMVIIKPHAFPHAENILTYLGTRMSGYAARQETVIIEAVPRDLIMRHYIQHAFRPFYENLVRQFEGKPVALGFYDAPDAELIAKIREICGPTAPEEARKKGKNIRAIFTSDSLSIAIAEGRAVDNVIHSPDSLEAAQREIKLWREFLDSPRSAFD